MNDRRSSLREEPIMALIFPHGRSTIEELLATPAVRKIARWRLPSMDDTPCDPAATRAFGQQHGASLLRAVGNALTSLK